MAELLITSRASSCENFWYPSSKDNFPALTKPRYNFEDKKSSPSDFVSELVHSKSDDLILQNAPLIEPDMQHGISDAAIQIQKDACVVYDDIVPSRNSKILSLYYSDSEMNTISSEKCDTEPEIPVLKLTGCFDDDECPSRRASKYIDDVSDKVDPECSIRDIISKNDFYKFVLFKKHYEKYLDISQKYEEAKNISYFLEEKYHEVKNQRDSLIESNKDLEKKLELKDLQLLEKDEELFKQIEKIFRLEEDCEKLRQEKEKIEELTVQLQKDKNEMYKQLRLQAEDSESKRYNFEKTRNDLMKQMSEIVLEKNNLEKENTELKEFVEDLERKIPHEENTATTSKKKNFLHLQQQMTDLKVKAKQSATLNSQLKKGMKHLATCRRRKCSVCAYTRATFGEYSSNRRRNSSKITTGCFPFQDLHHRKRQQQQNNAFDLDSLEDSCAQIAKRLSECSFSSSVRSSCYLPEGATIASTSSVPPRQTHIPFIDECSTPNESEEEREEEQASMCKNSTHSSLAGHGFYSDSGFSSELCESSFSRSKSNSIRRSSKWTKSFRKLIRRVSSRKTSEN